MYSFKAPFVFLATTFATAVLAIPAGLISTGVVIHPKTRDVTFDFNQVKSSISQFNDDLNSLPTAGESEIPQLVRNVQDLLVEVNETIVDMGRTGPFNQQDSDNFVKFQVNPIWLSLNDTMNHLGQQKDLFESVAANHPNLIPDTKKDLELFSQNIQMLENTIAKNFNKGAVDQQQSNFESLQQNINNTITIFS